MTRDLNKDIGSQSADGIIYNHLNLPWQIKVRSATGTKGTIAYIYDATGNKLKKVTMDSAGGAQTTTSYVGSFQYQGKRSLTEGSPADTLLFFGQEEGRVRVLSDTTGGQSRTSFKYDYFVKDHLGNTRMVLTDEQQSDKYPAATMEVADSALQNLYYSKLPETRADLPAGYPTDTTTNPNNKVSRLNGGTLGPKIGPGITLKVMAGDMFSIKASSWYRLNGANPGTPANPLPDLLAALISGVGGLPGGAHPSAGAMQANSTPISSNITQFLQDMGTSIIQTRPHAFVNWVLFDNQFNYVSGSSGFDQVGTDQELKKHLLPNLPVTKSGYLYIYVSNETPNVDVFFDNFQVTHTRGALLEESHYYPFGLTMAGISDKALKTNYAENKYRFNKGSELQNKEFSDGSGLEMYETQLRELDPQLGRWWQIDSKPDYAESPYSSMGNNPILHNDPLGDTVSPQLRAMLIAPPKNRDGDQTGRIRNATHEEYQENPLRAFGKDVIHLVAEGVGLNTVDDESANIRQKIDAGNLTVGDVGLAALKIGLASAREEGGSAPVEPYEVGMTADLKARSRGDNLDIHHTPQGQPAGQLIEGYDYSNAPGIALPKGEHQRIPTLKGEATAGSPRQQLAKDIRDLRNNTNAPNSSLQQLINMNKMLWPEHFIKKP